MLQMDLTEGRKGFPDPICNTYLRKYLLTGCHVDNFVDKKVSFPLFFSFIFRILVGGIHLFFDIAGRFNNLITLAIWKIHCFLLS